MWTHFCHYKDLPYHKMPIGITLTEANHERGSTDSPRSNYIVEEIFDGYTTSDLPLLLPRNTDTKSQHGDTASSETEIDAHDNEMETDLKVDRTKKHIKEFKFYDLQAFESDGTPFDFSVLKGKFVLIVNIATRCGREWHMESLGELSEKYKEDVVVLGFPSNTFLQNWLSAKETKDFFMERYKCKFKIMEKVRVNGWRQHRVFKFLKDHKGGPFGIKSVLWNFEKFLINRDGAIIKRYTTFKTPHCIMRDVDSLLKQERAEAETGHVKKMESSHQMKGLVSLGQKVIYV